MLKFFFTIITLLLLNVDSSAANSTPLQADSEVLNPEIVTQPAKIRGDGMLVDNDDLIVGIRNLDDPRNNDQVFFFFGVTPEGVISEESQYAVYQNPEVDWPDYIMQTLYPEAKDYSEWILGSSHVRDRISFEDEVLFFNGAMYESGAVLNGGIAVIQDGKLYYNGTEVEEGVMVLEGNIVR